MTSPAKSQSTWQRSDPSRSPADMNDANAWRFVRTDPWPTARASQATRRATARLAAWQPRRAPGGAGRAPGRRGLSGAATSARPAVGDGGRAPQDNLSAAIDDAGGFTPRAATPRRKVLNPGRPHPTRRRRPPALAAPSGHRPRQVGPTRAPGRSDLRTVGDCVTGVAQGPAKGVQARIESLEEDDDEDLPAPVRGVYIGCGACIGLLCLPWVKTEDRGREAFSRRWPRPPAPARR